MDVGYNQLDYRLRTDPRVIVRERTNVMALESLEPVPDFAVADLSFRSLRGAARHILSLTSSGEMIALIKPQYEWRDPGESFDGIVRDEDVLIDLLISLKNDLRSEGVTMAALIFSPVRGRKGNREFLCRLTDRPGSASPDDEDLARIVREGQGG